MEESLPPSPNFLLLYKSVSLLWLFTHSHAERRAMGSHCESTKPHAVLVPYPAQGHVNPMMKLAKILHCRGFYITFVHSEYNKKRLLRSRGPHALDGLPDFRFEAIPDGLPPSDGDSTQDIAALNYYTNATCLGPLLKLLDRLQRSASAGDVPPISCVVADGAMTFAIKAANLSKIPGVWFWTASACGLVGHAQYRYLVDTGIVPLKDESYLTNGFLEQTKVDWLPGINNLRLRDLPSFMRTTDPDAINLNFFIGEVEESRNASMIIINTFDDFEANALQYLSSMYSLPIFTIGPLQFFVDQTPHNHRLWSSIDCNLWKEDTYCLHWLDSKEPNSVIYVNYGSIATMTSDELVEFAWGLASSKCNFLWVVRPDIVKGESVIQSDEFKDEIQGRGLVVNWCAQEQVLNHPAVAGFLTHCGWNSTIESVCAGKIVLCWPFFGEQPTNCRYACVEWGIGMEVGPVVKREELRRMVVDVIKGSDEVKKMKEKALDWKRKAEESTRPGGSSHQNLEKFIDKLLQNFNSSKVL